MTNLSPHFTLEELTITEVRDLDNTPSPKVVEHLKVTAQGLEFIRTILGDKPMHINSGYRSIAVNARVGGSRTSDHPNGWCADFICPEFGTPLAICEAIHVTTLHFDQLIEEGTWVHISFSPRMRQEILTKRAAGGYQDGLPSV
jgi:hypothetical protein